VQAGIVERAERALLSYNLEVRVFEAVNLR
jgi:hypothetical protein